MLKTVQTSGATLAVTDVGKGPVLLLVHGFPLDHTMWQHQLDGLAGLRMIAPDLRGFGGSEVSPGTVTMEQFADDLAGVLDELGVRGPVTYCGLSMGGYIAWPFVRRHGSRLGRLILCDTRAVADTPQAAEERRATAERVRREGTGALARNMSAKLFAGETRASQPEVVESMQRVMERTAPEGAAAALLGMAARSDASALLPELRIPTLVICGQYDSIATVAEMKGIAQAIPGARFVEIPRAGHMAPLEQPAPVNAAIREFVLGLGKRHPQEGNP